MRFPAAILLHKPVHTTNFVNVKEMNVAMHSPAVGDVLGPLFLSTTNPNFSS